MTYWIKFANNVPECGKYKEEDLPFLAQLLCNFEDEDEAKQQRIQKVLKDLELGVAQWVEGKRVVKVQWI